MPAPYGTGVALATPFQQNGAIDFAAIEKLLGHTASDVDYYVVMGTTGESVTLTLAEKKEILAFVKKNNVRQLPIILGVGGNNTKQAIEEMSRYDWEGVDALLSVTPYYNKPSQEGLYQHFMALADAAPVPIILYNVPGRTGTNIVAPTVARLSGHANIIAVKEASGNLEQWMNIRHTSAPDFQLVSGDDLMTYTAYTLGGSGVISVLANAFPQIFKHIKNSIAEQDWAAAASHQYRLLKINGLMYEESNPCGLKYLLSLMGICHPYTRLPLVPVSESLQQKIKREYARIRDDL